MTIRNHLYIIFSILLATSSLICLFLITNSSLIADSSSNHIATSNNCPHIFMPLTMNNYIPKYFVETEEKEQNNTFSTSNGPLISEQVYIGYVSYITDENDVYSFFIHNSGVFSVELQNHDVEIGQLQLFEGKSLKIITGSLTPRPLNYLITRTNTAPTLYHINLFTDLNFSYTIGTPYNLRLTLPPTPTPLPKTNQYFISFNEEFVVSNKQIARAQTTSITKHIPAGIYQIILASAENHPDNSDQTSEMWHLNFYDVDEALIQSSNSITDIKQNQNCVIEIVNDRLYLSEPAEFLKGFHSAYPDTSSSNSVLPVYAIIEEIK